MVAARASGLIALFLVGLVMAGEQAPDLELPDLEGRTQLVGNYTDRVTVVHFWATWCSPCLKELPQLLETASSYEGRGLRLVLVAADNREAVQAFVTRHGISRPVLIDQYGKALRSFRARGLPSTTIIDRYGRIAAVESGMADWSDDAMRTRLQKLLP